MARALVPTELHAVVSIAGFEPAIPRLQSRCVGRYATLSESTPRIERGCGGLGTSVRPSAVGMKLVRMVDSNQRSSVSQTDAFAAKLHPVARMTRIALAGTAVTGQSLH